MKFIFENTPDGRNKLWTLLFVILIPVPFMLLFLNFITEGIRKGTLETDFLLAFVGLILFIILWSKQVVTGSYNKQITSQIEVSLYKFSGWGLIFAFAILTSFLVKEGLQNLEYKGITENSLLLSLVITILSYIGWKIGAILKCLGESPLTRYKREHDPTTSFLTPHQILEQTILGVIGYMIASFTAYFIISYFRNFI
jgi:hypothetical protein